jgi:hypothetical protein
MKVELKTQIATLAKMYQRLNTSKWEMKRIWKIGITVNWDNKYFTLKITQLPKFMIKKLSQFNTNSLNLKIRFKKKKSISS